MEEEQISGSINSFSDRSNYNSSHDTNPNNYYYDEDEESSSSHNHRSKRSKHAPMLEEEDRISALPDSILLSILCFLPINDAIKTGVLSKRWASLWTSLPSLSFDSGSIEYLDDFTSAVDNTLLLHRAHKLTNFDIRFECDYDTKLNPRLDLWVRFATNARVEKLSLHLWSPDCLHPDRYQLPQHLYANEFVSEFNFSCCKILPNGLPHWSSLKRLCIGHSALSEDVIRKVLMGSPRLESLELHQFWGFNRLDIVSESLRKLVIDSYVQHLFESEERKLELEIVAPKIECLEILGCFYMNRCRIKDVSALVEAKLDFDMRMEEEGALEEFQDIVRDILEGVHHVKKLTVGSSCLMALSIMTPRSAVSFNALLAACNYSKMFGKVPQLFDEMPKRYRFSPDKISYGILVKSYCAAGSPEKAVEILKEMEEKRVEITAVTFTTILDALYRQGKSEEAEELWDVMVKKGCEIDVAAYNVRIMYAHGGDPENVKALINEISNVGLKPDTISYNYLMTCYCKSGMMDEAKKVYEGLEENGCNPNAATFRTLVYYLCRNGDYEKGYKVFKESVKVHKIPDFATMKNLVEGLVEKKKMKEAKGLIRTIKKKFPPNVVKTWIKFEEKLGLASVDAGPDEDDEEAAA